MTRRPNDSKARALTKTVHHWLKRFPIPRSPREIARLRSSPAIFVNSIPKAGTNLLGRVAANLPPMVPRWRYHIGPYAYGAEEQVRYVRRGQVATAHAKWSSRAQTALDANPAVVAYLMVRDPRDIAVSNALFIGGKATKHRLHEYYSSLPSDEERILASVLGIPSSKLQGAGPSLPLAEHFRGFTRWLSDSRYLLVRFEDLIGEAGGGSERRQRDTVARIGAHAGLALSPEEVKRVADSAFSQEVWTYRKGQIGDWRNYLTPAVEAAFKEATGEVLVSLGYESGL